MKPKQTYEITEDQIVAYLRQKRAELQEATRQRYARVQFALNGHGELICEAYAHEVGCTTGATLDTAIDILAEMSGPLHRAARIRAEAAALITQAEVLETAARENLT